MKNNILIFLSIFVINTVAYSQGLKKLGKSLTNVAPVAKAGKDMKVYPGTNISFDGSKSWDINGDKLEYEWAFPIPLVGKNNEAFYKTDTLKSSNKKSSINYAKTFTKTFSFKLPDKLPPKSEFIVKLKVKDEGGLSSTDSLVVEVLKSISADSMAVIMAAQDEKKKSKKKRKKSNISVSIQGLSTTSISSLQKEAVNSLIYKTLIDMGVEGAIDPSKSMLSIYNSASKNSEKGSNAKAKNDSLNYNPNCDTDSCAAVNAIITKADYVLSWELNEHSILSLHFYNAKEYNNSSREYFWSMFSVPIDSIAEQKMKLPKLLAIDDENNLFIVNSNDSEIYKNSFDKKLEKLTYDKSDKNYPKNPSGIDVGPDGILYVSDEVNNSVFSYQNGKYNVVYKGKSIEKPTSLRALKDGSVVVVCESGESVKLVARNGRVSTVLNKGIVSGISDIAVDKKGNYYIVTPHLSQVSKIINSRKIEKIAGMKEGFGLKGNSIPAKEAVLINPISIDFDPAGRLYIVEKGKDNIRYINDGKMFALAARDYNWDGKGSEISPVTKISNMSHLRIGSQSNIFIAQMIDQSIKCITISERPSWIGYKNLIDPMSSVNESGILGLENYFRENIPKIMKGYVPRQKKSFRKSLKSFNRNIGKFFKERPVLVAALLIIVSQVSSSIFDNSSISDTPPDWPF